MAIRNMLHLNKMDDFQSWLILNGWTIVKAQGIFEVLRGKKDKRTLIIYKKTNAKQHVTVRRNDFDIVFAYFKDRKNTNDALKIFSQEGEQ